MRGTHGGEVGLHAGGEEGHGLERVLLDKVRARVEEHDELGKDGTQDGLEWLEVKVGRVEEVDQRGRCVQSFSSVPHAKVQLRQIAHPQTPAAYRSETISASATPRARKDDQPRLLGPRDLNQSPQDFLPALFLHSSVHVRAKLSDGVDCRVPHARVLVLGAAHGEVLEVRQVVEDLVRAALGDGGDAGESGVSCLPGWGVEEGG